MWIYQHVEGEVPRYFQLLEMALDELHDSKRPPSDQALEDQFEQLRDEVERVQGRLVAYEAASEDARANARSGYLTTMDLVQLLADRVERRGDARFEDLYYAAL